MTILRVNVTETADGLLFRHARKQYPLTWPTGVWRKLPKGFREVLTDHLALLLTHDLPLVAGADGVELNRPRPLFSRAFRIVTLGSIPQAVESYDESTDEVIARYRSTEYRFSDDTPRRPPAKKWKTRPRAVVPFSSGKDSLASLGLAREMGLEPIGVYIDDTVSPSENRIKRKHLERLAAMGCPTQLVVNRVEQLNDFANWSGEETMLGYMHMMTGFTFIALPIARAFNARYIVLGNQQNMNFPFRNKDGYLTYPSFDQTSAWTSHLDSMMQVLTTGSVRVFSLIEPLTNIAIMKLLFERYPDLAELLVCCDSLDASAEPRWCQECSKCARLALMMRAFGVDPADVGISRDMLGEAHADCYALFAGTKTDNYERSDEAREEQMLAFLLADEKGAQGELMTRFRREFGARARHLHDRLIAKFMKPYPLGTVPTDLRQPLTRILTDAMQTD